MRGALALSASCAVYEETDFVDYFASTTGVSEEHLQRIAEVPKCLAVIDAFVSTPMRLGKALFLVGDELDRLRLPQAGGSWARDRKEENLSVHLRPPDQTNGAQDRTGSCRSKVFQSQRRKRSSASARYLSYHLVRGSSFMSGWTRRLHSRSLDPEIEAIWQSIRRRDEREYLWYWQISHGELLRKLLCNRRCRRAD